MKALKTDLARRLLADPEAKSKLRDFLNRPRSSSDSEAPSIAVTTSSGEVVVVRPRVVPKAP
jgi:hypothetical protein